WTSRRRSWSGCRREALAGRGGGAGVRVLGIDPGSRLTGWGVVETRGGGFLHVASGTIVLAPAADLGARLARLHTECLRLIAAWGRAPAAWRARWLRRDGHDRVARRHARREEPRAARARRRRRGLRGPGLAPDLRRPAARGRHGASPRAHRGARGRDRALRLPPPRGAGALPPAPQGEGPRAAHRAGRALGHAARRPPRRHRRW